MKARLALRIFSVAAFSSLSLIAQQPELSPDSTSGLKTVDLTGAQMEQQKSAERNSSDPAVAVPTTANSPEIANPRLRPVHGQLVSRIDAKSAKMGDSVIVRTTESATTSTGLEIPSGTRIVGRVTDVEAKGQGGENSRLAIQFDRAELRSGQKLPIESVIQSVAPASASGTQSSAAGAHNGAAQSMAAPASTPASTSPQGQPAGTIVARNGNVAIRTTEIPGVLLAANVDGRPFSNASGALLSAQHDVSLEGGTTVVLAIASAPSEASAR